MRFRWFALAGAVVLAAGALTPGRAAAQQRDSTQRDSTQRDSTRRDSTRRDRSARDSTTTLNAVTIVATPASRSEPRNAAHITAAEIRQTPANSTYDLLRQTAGLEVHQQGQGPGFASDASLRGFSSDHSTDLALWVDGVPVNEPVNGHAEGYNDWSVLFPASVRDIDVIHGPTSALFGNFALAGVVNVRTIERFRGTEVLASGGSYGQSDATVMTGFDHGTAGGGVAGVRFEHSDGFRPNGGFDVAQGHARLVHNISPTTTIDGGMELLGSRWHSAGFLSDSEFNAGLYDIVSNPSDGGYKRRAQQRVSIRSLIGNSLWRTTAYATQGEWQLFLTIPPEGGRFEGSGSQSEEEDRRYGFGLTSALTRSFADGEGEFTVGGESRWDHSRYQNWFTTDRQRDSVADLLAARQLSGALFVQGHRNFNAHFRIDAGARYDELSTASTPTGEASVTAAHGVFSPKLGATVRLNPLIGVYADVARGFRSTDGVIADPTLTPIVAWSREAGVKLDRGHASASAALFQMDVSNEQTFDPITLETTNGGKSVRKGVELEWHVPLAPAVSASGDWTFLDATYQHLSAAPEGGGPADNLDGLRVYNTARYTGVAALDVMPVANWRVRLSGNWVGPYSPFDEPGVVLGGYGLMHASISATLGRVELTLGARNLFDRRYPEVVAGGIVSPGEPRSLTGAARMVF